MDEVYCDELLQHYPSFSDFQDLRFTYICNCVFNILLAQNTIVSNMLAIFAIRRCSSLPQTLKTFLLSLSASDVGVGLVVQPIYISLLINWLQQNDSNCIIAMVYQMCGTFFSVTSFLGVLAISVDRFLAVHLHLRYKELVTHRRVVAVVVSIWLFSAVCFILTFWNLHQDRRLFRMTGGVFCLIIATFVYIRVYLVARRHKNKIQSLHIHQAQHRSSVANFTRLINSATVTFYVYLVFLVCYLPLFICLAAIRVNNASTNLKKLFLFSLTLLYLNSSLNPVIYCWRMRHIRRAIMDVIRNLLLRRNHTSRWS